MANAVPVGITYVIRPYGDVTAGPKAGTKLFGDELTLPECNDVADVERHCERYRGVFAGRIEIHTRRYVSRPRKGFVWSMVGQLEF